MENNFKNETIEEDVVRIVNPKQVYFYLQNNLHPIRLEAGYNGRIVYVFQKRDSLMLFHEWCEMCKAYAAEKAKCAVSD